MDKNKREAIEKAVVELGGKWGGKHNFDYPCLFTSDEYGGSYVTGTNAWSSGFVNIFICTRAEFEQVKAELQNKPSWADAPEWAMALGQDSNGSWCWLPHYDETDRDHEEWMLNKTDEVTFIIASTGKVIGDWRTTLEGRPEPNSKPRTNDWHTRGELPPVGEECEVLHNGEWHKTYIIGHDRNGAAVYDCDSFDEEAPYDGNSHASCFRPIRTERDELIEIIESVGNQSNGFLADTIIDQGWRPTK